MKISRLPWLRRNAEYVVFNLPVVMSECPKVHFVALRFKSFQESHFIINKLNVIFRRCALHFNLFESVIDCYVV